MDLKGWVRGTSKEQHLGAQASRPVPGIRWWHQMLCRSCSVEAERSCVTGKRTPCNRPALKSRPFPTVPVHSSTPVLLGATQAPTQRVNINSIGFNIGVSVPGTGSRTEVHRESIGTGIKTSRCHSSTAPWNQQHPHAAPFPPPPSPTPRPSTTTSPIRPSTLMFPPRPRSTTQPPAQP